MSRFYNQFSLLIVSFWGVSLMILLTSFSGVLAQAYNPKTLILDNGLHIVVIENNRAPVVTQMLFYKVGSADDPYGKSGLAHFLEHLMFKGTKKNPPGRFSETVARLGGKENAFTGHDYTGYYQTVPVEHLGLIMELESDRMTGLVLNEELVNSERKVILEERRSRVENNPQSLLNEQIDAALFINHPYGIPVIGWENEILELETKDIVEFYETWYSPNNAVLVVSGDVSSSQVFELAKSSYGKVPFRFVPLRERVLEPFARVEKKVILKDEKVGYPTWIRRWVVPSYSSNYKDKAFAIEVFVEILGGSLSSRLYSSLVVDQPLAVSTGAWYFPNYLGESSLGIWISPRPNVDINRVVISLEKELKLVEQFGVKEEELKIAKNRLIDSSIYTRDSLSGPAYLFGVALSTGQSVSDVEQWSKRISEVTVEQVNSVAREILASQAFVTGVLMPKVKN